MVNTDAEPNAVPVGRLAPSPTGAQHIGNARTYLLAWLSIRSRGGRIVLRMEDIDSPRVKPGADEQAIDDLRWLGLDWDEGPDIGGPHGPYVQTQRLEHYEAALARLQSAERIYPCTCSRTDVQAAASAPHVGQEGPLYPGTCRQRMSAHASDILGESFSWRFRATPEAHAIDDLVAGHRTCRVAEELGDFVIAKRDGFPAYQLAVVADDHAMRVTEVLRGDDLLPSAFRQCELYAFFGWQPPRFAHVPLVVGPDGRRLAKRHGDTRLSLLREAGVPAERLVGLLAWSCRLRPDATPIAAADLLDDFDLGRLPREPFVFGETMFDELLKST
ncbi:MAG: tRNA glutamyl-Q(34) synthetase GluQRS [Pirellulaceae bacterium]